MCLSVLFVCLFCVVLFYFDLFGFVCLIVCLCCWFVRLFACLPACLFDCFLCVRPILGLFVCLSALIVRVCVVLCL